MSDVSLRLSLQEDVSSKLKQTTTAAKEATESLKAMGKQVDSAFGSQSPGKFASDLGNAVNTAEKEVESLGDAIDDVLGGSGGRYSAGVSDSFDEAAKNAEKLADEAEEAGKSLDNLADNADKLGDSVDDIGGKDSGLDGLSQDAENAGRSLGEADTKASSLAGTLKTLFAVVSAAAVLSAVGGYAKEAINVGQSYTSMVSEVQAISGASAEEMRQLESAAREYGATTVFSASEAAEALKYMSLAGWDANQSTSALGGVLDLAAASGMGLGQASDMVTDYLTAFGMEASQATYFADMLAYAQSNSNTTAEQLGMAYQNSAAMLNASGQDVETATSLLEAMANQGYKGSEAGTALAATMRDITNNMEDGAIEIGDASIAVQDSAGNFRDLTDILFDVEEATDGMGDAQKAAALSATFTSDSMKAVNMIMAEGMDAVSGYEEALRSASGTAETMADVMNDNLAGDVAELESAWEEMQIQTFEAMEGPLREGVQYLYEDLVPTLTEWVPDAFGAIAEGASKIGNALKPIVDTVLKNPGAIAKAFASIGTGMLAFAGISRLGTLSNLVSQGKSLSGAGGLIGGLTKLGGVITAHPWATGAAVIAASVATIAGAVDYYNDLQVEQSLTESFGDVELSQPEIEDIAGRIIGVEWVANVNLALGEFENAEAFHQQAEEALQANDKIMWIASVQTTLSQGEPEPVSPFIDAIQTVLAGRQDDSGLEYLANVDTTVTPNGGDNTALVQSLVDFANSAVLGAEGTELEEYAKEVAVQISPEGGGDNTALIQSLVDFANGVVSGASGEELTPYLDSVLVNLTPEEGEDFMSSLAQLTGDIVSQELTPEPTYRDTVSVVLTPEMQEDFKTNIETFLSSKQSELNSLTFAAVTSMETVLGDKAGSAFMAQIETWAAQDTADMSVLSNSLTALVEDALTDGVLDVEEQAAIEILQNKINNIVTGWKEAQAEAEWQTLETKWSGANLTSDSFIGVMEDAREQRQTAMEALDANTTEMYSVFNSWMNSGKITGTQHEQLTDLWEQNYKNTMGETLARSLSFGNNTYNDTYGALIEGNLQRIQDLGGGDTMRRLNEYAQSGNVGTIIEENLLNANRNFYSKNNNKALAEAYDAMKPDVAEMQGLLDSYRETGQQIPQALMESYNEAISVGAAAGDSDAAWQHYANSIMNSGNEQLIDVMTNPDNPMYEAIRTNMAPELANAIDRALYAAENTIDNADLSELFNSILGLDDPNAEIDMSRLAELCEKYGVDISEYLENNGIEVDGSNAKMELKDFDPAEAAQYSGLTATGNAITLEGGEIALEYEVNVGDTLSGIAEKTGVALEKLQEANQQIFDERGTWDLIYEGDLIYIPNVETDISGVGAAMESAGSEAKAIAEAATSEPIETEQQVNVEYTKGSEDKTALTEGNSVESIPVTAPADVTVTQGSFDASTALESTQNDLNTAYATAFPVDGGASITIAKASDNIAALYSQVGTELQSAFNTSYAVSTSASITVNYSLANPSASISFGGAGSGSSSVYAWLHAAGGYFDEPHLGIVAEAGGEYIIPIDGSDRSRDMVSDAGRMLGMGMEGGADLKPVNLKQEAGQAASGGNGDRTVTVNVNGNGSIQVNGGGVSKERIVDLMLENLKDVFMDIVQQDIIEEGDGMYEF